MDKNIHNDCSFYRVPHQPSISFKDISNKEAAKSDKDSLLFF